MAGRTEDIFLRFLSPLIEGSGRRLVQRRTLYDACSVPGGTCPIPEPKSRTRIWPAVGAALDSGIASA